MRNHDLAMLAYLKLAELSGRKKQLIGRDKLLVLAGASACRAGCLTVADQCRELIVQQHPRHQLAKFATFADALRSDDFPSLVTRLEKLCSAEQAEFLAREWGLWTDAAADWYATEIDAEAKRLLEQLQSAS